MFDLTCFNWVQLVKKSDLPPNAKLVAFYLSTFMNMEHNIAWPSQARIAHETGLSKPTVVKWMEYLVQNEWLFRKKHERRVSTVSRGIQMNNEYQIRIPSNVVKQINHVGQRGKTDKSTWLNSEADVVKPFNPNNNINNNIITRDDSQKEKIKTELGKLKNIVK